MAKLYAARRTEPVSETGLAIGHIALGELDAACERIEEAAENRDFRIRYLAVDPVFRPLARDPRYLALLKKMNLSPVASGVSR